MNKFHDTKGRFASGSASGRSGKSIAKDRAGMVAKSMANIAAANKGAISSSFTSKPTKTTQAKRDSFAKQIRKLRNDSKGTGKRAANAKANLGYARSFAKGLKK